MNVIFVLCLIQVKERRGRMLKYAHDAELAGEAIPLHDMDVVSDMYPVLRLVTAELDSHVA